MLITVEYIQREVNRIADAKDDHEIAHGLEDALHRKVLVYIAEMNPTNAAQLAGAVLRSNNDDFS